MMKKFVILSLSFSILATEYEDYEDYGSDDSDYDYERTRSVFRQQHPNTSAGTVFDMLRVMMCAVCFPEISQQKLSKCPIKIHDDIKFGMRNYGCNCLSEIADQRYMSHRADSQDVHTWHMHYNGEPADYLDYHCKLLGLRYECINIDLAKGRLSEIPGGMDIGPNTIHEESDPLKKQKYVCGDYHRAAYFDNVTNVEHPVFCGTRDNPDYINGVPEGQECNKYVCEIERQFALDTFRTMGATCNVTEFFENNLENYFIWSKMEKPNGWKDVHRENLIRYPGNKRWYNDNSTTAERCVLKHGLKHGKGELDCCGEYPHRYPYRPFTQDCCDGTIKQFGSC